jgi:hypothetical protein
MGLALVARVRGDFTRATALYEQSLALSRALGDGRLAAYTLIGLADVARDQGEYERVAELTKDSLGDNPIHS